MGIKSWLKGIKLGYGAGSAGKQACWVSAYEAYRGNKKWTDKDDGTSKVINELCIRINDLYEKDDDARTEDIMEFGFFEPFGTLNPDIEQDRIFKLCDAVVRKMTPFVLRQKGLHTEAEKLEGLKPIVDKESAYAVTNAADAYAVTAADAAAAADADAAVDAVDAVANAVDADCKRKFVKEFLFPVLREMIDMGKKKEAVPAKPVFGIEKFKMLVGIKPKHHHLTGGK